MCNGQPRPGGAIRRLIQSDLLPRVISFRGGGTRKKPREILTVSTPAAHDAYAAFRIPAYRRYFVGNLIFILGLQMQKAAVGWEMYERTGSALNLGLVGLVQFIPQLALVAVAGHITDIYNRKHVLMSAVSLSAVAAVVLAVNSALDGPILLMYACLFVSGTARAFWMPSRSALLPRIVPLSIFSNAVSWNSSGFEISTLVGPAIGGLLIHYTGVPVVYVLTAIEVGCFAFLLSRISYRHEPPAPSPLSLHALSAGVRFIFKTKVVLAVMMLDMFGILLGGATALMPIYATDILHVGALGFGCLLAAPSAGAIISGGNAGASRSPSPRGKNDSGCRSLLRRRDNRLRNLAVLSPIPGHALHSRSVRQHQRRCSFDPGPDRHPG